MIASDRRLRLALPPALWRVIFYVGLFSVLAFWLYEPAPSGMGSPGDDPGIKDDPRVLAYHFVTILVLVGAGLVTGLVAVCVEFGLKGWNEERSSELGEA